MWAEASRSVYLDAWGTKHELLDLNLCPDGFQSAFALLIPFYVPFISV